MLTLEPYQLKVMARELITPAAELFTIKLVALHEQHRVNQHNDVVIPMYWAETVFIAATKMLIEFPRLKFGSITDDRNKLRFTTIPAHNTIENMKIKLNNTIDKLIMDSIEDCAQRKTKPIFLR